MRTASGLFSALRGKTSPGVTLQAAKRVGRRSLEKGCGGTKKEAEHSTSRTNL